jgi:uroporphyrin-III C-methyltransferase/precorrin-2 dehydrogenase/sirohydrochlorin ferrochelatase
LADLVRLHALRSPSLLIVGEVAAFARTLAWFGDTPVVSQDLPATVQRPAALRQRRIA